MAISFQCPHCQKAYKVKDALAGKRVTCTQCQQVISVPRTAAKSVDHHALEALAGSALSDNPVASVSDPQTPIPGDDQIPFECPYCFEHVRFSAAAAGKQAPCPSCRRLVKVPAFKADRPKDWRQIEHNLTMARKVDQPAPEGAWGNAQLQQQIVSREALLEARVVKDRKELAAPQRGKLYAALGIIALVGGGLAFWTLRDRSIDENRIGLVADAVSAADAKGKTPLPTGWPAAIYTAAGSFYLHEPKPDLKAAVRQFQSARAAVEQTESPSDRFGLRLNVALAQAELVGDDAERCLPWDDAQKEMRQTMERFQDLPREYGWQAIEAVTRVIGSKGAKEPMMVRLAPQVFPGESDRGEALACVALTLAAKGNPDAERVAELATAAGGESPRLAALMIVRKQLAQAKQLVGDPVFDKQTPLNRRLAYAEGFARTGDPADLDKARQAAMTPGAPEDQTMALAMFADGLVDAHQEIGKDLEMAVNFVTEQGVRITLPAWAVERLANACRRAGRGDLARQLAEKVSLPASKPWLELAGVLEEVDASNAAVEPGLADRVGDKTAAQAVAWITIARHNAKQSRGDVRATIDGWPHEPARPCGYAGAALGLQDRVRR